MDAAAAHQCQPVAVVRVRPFPARLQMRRIWLLEESAKKSAAIAELCG